MELLHEEEHLDTRSQTGRLYGVEGIPQTVVIGKDGIVKEVHVGYSPGSEAKIKQEIEELLAEEKKR